MLHASKSTFFFFSSKSADVGIHFCSGVSQREQHVMLALPVRSKLSANAVSCVVVGTADMQSAVPAK